MSLDPWTVVRLTAAKFKPLMFSVLGFALPYIADIRIFMILYNFWNRLLLSKPLLAAEYRTTIKSEL
jgi:hypothetical protein